MSRRSLLEEAAKAVMLAPIGVALIVRDSLPNLLTDGRAEIDRQVRAARMVGTFALTRLRKEAEARLHDFAQESPPAAPPTSASQPTSTDVGTDAVAGMAPGAMPVAANEFTGPVVSARPSPARSATTRPASTRKPSAARASSGQAAPANAVRVGDAESGASAASLSDEVAALLALPASQLIGKLAALSADERLELAAAERAGRQRQTVLHKLEQLQS
jgi:hypothetical protein